MKCKPLHCCQRHRLKRPRDLSLSKIYIYINNACPRYSLQCGTLAHLFVCYVLAKQNQDRAVVHIEIVLQQTSYSTTSLHLYKGCFFCRWADSVTRRKDTWNAWLCKRDQMRKGRETAIITFVGLGLPMSWQNKQSLAKRLDLYTLQTSKGKEHRKYITLNETKHVTNNLERNGALCFNFLFYTE